MNRHVIIGGAPDLKSQQTKPYMIFAVADIDMLTRV